MTNLKEKIEREIKKYKRVHGKMWAHRYFSNFHCNLPGGFLRTKSYNKNFKLWGDDCSELLRKQTLGEFYGVIDDIIKKEKIDTKRILKLQEDFKRTRDYNVYNELCGLVTPIYIQLRELGYKDYPDLTR